MTPSEAMVRDKPAVATVNEGSFQKTVINGKTGLPVKANVEWRVKPSNKSPRNPSRYKMTCMKRAKKLDTNVSCKRFEISSRVLS